MPSDAHLTTPLIWTCTAILAVLDGILIALARHLVSREQFRRMRWRLVVASGVFFLLVWITVLWWGWDWFYCYIFPTWARYLLPPVFAIWYASLALGMHWLSLKLHGNPGVTWCILGGVEGLLSHIYAIYGLGAATKPPIMLGTDPFTVLIFAVFEKAFYWSLILLACRLIWGKMHLAKG
jgi:energy-converting hydrogenase Eha subunit A